MEEGEGAKPLVSESELPAASAAQVETAQRAADVAEEPTQEFKPPTTEQVAAMDESQTPPAEQPQVAAEPQPQKKSFLGKLFGR